MDRVDIAEPRGKSRAREKRIEMRAHTEVAPRFERTPVFEASDDFPSALAVASRYGNLGSEELRLEAVVSMPRRLNASLVDARVVPYSLYSFHGSSGEWCKEDVVEISRDFIREIIMGAPTPRGQGGGVPVVAFWTPRGDEELDLGQDFASTIGAGAVVGTKFVWPDPGKFKEAALTPAKEARLGTRYVP